MFEEEATKIEAFVVRLEDLRKALNVEDVLKQIVEVEAKMADQNFCNDP